MHKIKLIITALIIVGCLLVYYFWYNDKKGITDTTIDDPKEIVSQPLQKEIQEIDKMTVQEKIKKNNLKNHQLEELLDNRVSAFDSDPFIDAELITLSYNRCIKYLNKDKQKKMVKSWKAIDLKSNSQQKYETEFNKYCEKTHSENKEYLLTSPEKLQLMRKSIINDDETSKIIFGDYNKQTIDIETFVLKPRMEHLRDINPNLLLNANKYFYRYFNYQHIYKDVKIINSDNSLYIRLVLKYALNLFACNAGADCGLHSDLVANLCLNNNLCGTDYNDILTNRMSEGIRGDILLMYNYYKKILN
jgi:hypothetical protein